MLQDLLRRWYGAAAIAAVTILLWSTAGETESSDGTLPLPAPVLQPSGAVAALSTSSRPPVFQAFPLTVVAEIETTFIGGIKIVADTDHDGLMEIVGTYRSSATLIWQIVVVERQYDGSFVTSFPLGTTMFGVRAAGDLDGDGRSEIVGHRSDGRLVVYESVDEWSFPTNLVWESPQFSNVEGYLIVADSDRDGRMEIIHSVNALGGTMSRLVIFENVGDNAFTQVLDLETPGNGASGEKVILDLDRDGKTEIAFGGSNGWVHVIESVADNQWQRIWSDSTGLYNAYAAEGGTDSDANGRPEFISQGNDFSVFPLTTWPARVYESAADNQFHLAAVIPVPSTGSGHTADASGDLDGDGDREYIAVEVRAVWDPPPGGLWVYTAVSEGNWQPIAMLPNPGNRMGVPHTCDLNANGKSEILWASPDTTRLFEYLPTSDATAVQRMRTLIVSPNPVRRSATIVWNREIGTAAALHVYDAAGRLVERRDVRGQTLDWRPATLASGVYYLELRDRQGSRIAADRALLLQH